MKALEYLKEVQEYYMRNGGITPLGKNYFPHKEIYNDEIFAETSNKLMNEGYLVSSIESFKEVVDSMKNEFTAYEPPTSIFIFGEIKNDLRIFFSHMHKLGFFDPNKLYFPEDVAVGTTQFGEINAMAIASPGLEKNRIILFDSGLFIFINSLAKVVSSLFPKKISEQGYIEYNVSERDIDSMIFNDTRYNELFVNLITTYLIEGHSRFSEKFVINNFDDKLTDILRYTSELFILAHEYGHILLNHLSISSCEKRKIAERLEVETWQIDWKQEFQADGFASIAVIRINHVLKDLEAPIAFAGVAFFFFAIDVLYKCIGIEFSETHPSPTLRLETLYNRLYSDTNDKDLVNEIKEFGNSVGHIITSLWNKNEKEILAKLQEANCVDK